MTGPDDPAPVPDDLHAPADAAPLFCTDGPDLCRVRVLSEREWNALSPADRPRRARFVAGLGWVVAEPGQNLN
jgi:hypothetical protein